MKLEIFHYADLLKSMGPGSMSEKRVETDFLGTPHSTQHGIKLNIEGKKLAVVSATGGGKALFVTAA